MKLKIKYDEIVSFIKKKAYRVYQLFGWYVIRSKKWKWDEKLYGLLADVPEDKINLYTTVLNNQHFYITSMVEAGTYENLTEEMDIEKITKLILDNLTILDIVGCQPMQGPVGTINLFRYKEQKKNKDGSSLLSLEVISAVIEAQTRRLIACWPLESAQDAKALDGLDIIPELQQAIAAAVTQEITAEQIKNLKALSTKVKMKSNDPSKIILSIQNAANDIAVETRRGAGNCAVLSSVTFSRVIDFLRDDQSPAIFDETDLGKSPCVGALIYVGTLNGTIKLYVDIFYDKDSILIGYKGDNKIDAGYFFNPYIMLLKSGIETDTETFVPKMRLMTRYNIYSVDNAKAYYRELTFKKK